MLQVEGGVLNYGSFRALNGVSLHVKPGEIVVMLGANGAGKSSLFLAISGLRKLAAGTIRFEKDETSGRNPPQIVKAGIIQCPEGRKLFPGMSVHKNLLLGGYVYRRQVKETLERLESVFAMFPDLRSRQDTLAGSLSGGQQQMVAIGRALMGRPRMLLLDEPSLGLAPLVVEEVMKTIVSINQAGTTVLLAEQNASAALQIAHRGYVIESGRIVMEGDCETLLGDERIRKAYIGA